MIAALERLLDETTRAACATPSEEAFRAAHGAPLEKALAGLKEAKAPVSKQVWAPFKAVLSQLISQPAYAPEGAENREFAF